MSVGGRVRIACNGHVQAGESDERAKAIVLADSAQHNRPQTPPPAAAVSASADTGSRVFVPLKVGG